MTTITINENSTVKQGRGFANLLKKEWGGWWRTFTWAGHLLVYLLMVNGLTVFDAWDTRQTGGSADEAFVGFFAFHSLFVMAGVIISAQGSIVGERQNGTAAWILSKPVSRNAFLLSKLTALGGSMAIVGVLIPTIAAFITWQLFGYSPLWEVLPLVVVGLALMALFFLSFVLWLGTLFESRTAVATFGFLMLFAQMQLGNQRIGLYLPGGLVYHLTEAVAGLPIGSALIGMGITAGLTALFVALAMRRLQNVEF